MIWLIGQVWPFLLAAAVAGLVLTAVMSTRTVKVERTVQRKVEQEGEPAEPPDTVLAPLPADPAVETDAEVAAPFPAFRGLAGARPWEDDELWSRPVRTLAASSPTTTEDPSESAPDADEWQEAAHNWRSWAAAAASGSDAGAAGADRKEPAEQVTGTPFPVPMSDDEFPYAQPVEADRS